GRLWNIDNFKSFEKLGYISHPAFPSTFIKRDKKSNIVSIIGLFVDDMIVSSKYIGVLDELSRELMKSYRLKKIEPDDTGMQRFLVKLTVRWFYLPGAATMLIDAKMRGKSMKLKHDQEYVMKELIVLSNDNKKLIKMQGARAQEDLHSIIHGLGFIKNSDEVLTLVNNFKIDVRDTVETSLRNWNILNSIQKYSELKYNPKVIIAGIAKNFPKDITYQPLIKIIGKHKLGEMEPDVVTVIKELHEEIKELTAIRSAEMMFQMDKVSISNNTKEDATDLKEEMRIQAIIGKRSKNFDKRTNKYKVNKETGRNRSEIVPKGCRYCSNDRLQYG
ncbi:hypothetical protein CANINC_000292, partial [Pichia inconspicua]